MGKQVVKSGLVRLGGYDLTSDINSIALSLGAAALDITALNDLTKVYTPGLRDVKCAVKGFWDAANDGIIWDDISATDILSLSLSTTEGDVGFFMDSVPAQYQVTQEVGKVVAMSKKPAPPTKPDPATPWGILGFLTERDMLLDDLKELGQRIKSPNTTATAVAALSKRKHEVFEQELKL